MPPQKPFTPERLVPPPPQDFGLEQIHTTIDSSPEKKISGGKPGDSLGVHDQTFINIKRNIPIGLTNGLQVKVKSLTTGKNNTYLPIWIDIKVFITLQST